jgi:hypothetical protein
MERSDHEGGPPEFLATHPSHGTREQQIAEWLPEAQGYHASAPHAVDAPLPGAR